jgi:hypothetical protein
MNIKIFLERLQITPKVRDSGKWQVASGKWQVASARGSCFEKVEPSENDLFFVTVSSKSNLEAAMFGFFWGGARVHQLPRVPRWSRDFNGKDDALGRARKPLRQCLPCK